MIFHLELLPAPALGQDISGEFATPINGKYLYLIPVEFGTFAEQRNLDLFEREAAVRRPIHAKWV